MVSQIDTIFKLMAHDRDRTITFAVGEDRTIFEIGSKITYLTQGLKIILVKIFAV